jgi:hypothetical protein
MITSISVVVNDDDKKSKCYSGPIDCLCRAIAVDIMSYSQGRDRPILDVLKEGFGEDENTRIILARCITKAASIPADMTNSGWADTLVQTVIGDLIDSLLPISIYSQLASRGTSLTLDRNGNILLPARNTSATVSGSFIAPGAPIPVRQGQFAPLIIGTIN